MNSWLGAGASKAQRLASRALKQAIAGAGALDAQTVPVVLFAYAVLTIVVTYPVSLKVFTELAGRTDVYEYTWELWWAKRSVIDLHTNPADVVALYHPYGAHHPVLWLDVYLMWTSLPLVTVFGPLVAYNVQFLSSYLLTGFTTYLLCYSLTKKHWPSFVGGVIFAFSPWRSGRAAHGQLSLVLTHWLPLYVLFLIKVFKRPNLRNALLCGFFLALSVFSGFQHVAHFVIPATTVFLVYQHFANRRLLYSLGFMKNLGLALGLAAAMIAPFYLPVLQAWMAGELDYFRRFGLLTHAAPLLSFVVPPPTQLLAERIEPLRVLAQELLPKSYDVVYVGVVPMALAVYGAIRKKTTVWMILAASSAVLALGPLLRVGRDLVEYSIAGKTGFVLLPGALLTGLPFYEWVRDPSRFGELTVFCVAVMACYGVLTLSRTTRRRAVQLGMMSAMLMCILLDYSSFFPFPTEGPPIPEFYSALSRDSDDYGVLDVGPRIPHHRSMYFQTTHQHPIALGHMYRIPSEVRDYQRFLEQLLKPEPDIVNADGLRPILQQLDIRYVVLHKPSDAVTEEFIPFLTQSLGQPIYDDRWITAFDVPGSAATEGEELPLLMLGEQWHPIESIDGVPSRWMVNDATLYARVDREGPHQLALVAHPFGEPRHLQVFVNEELVEEYHVGGMQSYVTSPFVLKSGEWTPIRFSVPEGCEVPSEVRVEEADDRCLSMLFQQVSLDAS